jgi:hypothetical protein
MCSGFIQVDATTASLQHPTVVTKNVDERLEVRVIRRRGHLMRMGQTLSRRAGYASQRRRR